MEVLMKPIVLRQLAEAVHRTLHPGAEPAKPA